MPTLHWKITEPFRYLWDRKSKFVSPLIAITLFFFNVACLIRCSHIQLLATVCGRLRNFTFIGLQLLSEQQNDDSICF